MTFRLTYLFLFLVSTNTFSQEGLIFRQLDIPNIPSENINSIFIDNRGFNWISTDEGLVRFDGVNSSIFRSNPFDENTISDNSIKNVFQVNDNGVFISTISGLDYFDYESLNFKRIESNSSPTSNYKFSSYLFTSTENEGVYIYDLEKDTIIENLKFDPRNPLSISSSNFSYLQNNHILISSEEGDSTLWIGSTNGLNRYNLKTGSNKRFYSEDSDNSLPSNFIYDIFKYDKLLFIGTDKGLALININDNSIEKFDFFIDKSVLNIFEIGGTLCFHTLDGIFKLDDIITKSFTKIYSGNELNLKVTNKNEFVVWDDQSRVERVFYFNNEFQKQLLNDNSNIQINDINNFKGAYYISTNDGINKISEDLKNISRVYNRDEEIINIQENDFFRVLLTDKNIIVYEEEEIILSFEIDQILQNQDLSNPILYLDEDEFLYIGTNKLNVINLYDEEDIRVYENSSSGFNSSILLD